MTVGEPAISGCIFIWACLAQEREHVPGQLLKADPWAAVHDHVGGHSIGPQLRTGPSSGPTQVHALESNSALARAGRRGKGRATPLRVEMTGVGPSSNPKIHSAPE